MEEKTEEFDIEGGDLRRNRVLVEGMQGELQRIEAGMRNKQSAGSGAGAGAGGGGYDVENPSPAPTQDKSREAYQATTQTVMAMQDEMLDTLSAGVSRLHEQAGLMNEEAGLHSRLLEDMDLDIDRAAQSLVNETKRAEKVREESGVCKLYIIIAALSVLLVFLIVMAFGR